MRLHCNYLGSSESMDASGLLAIFQRSVENYSVRYIEFLGDGDSKGHKLIVQEAVYGDKEVRKLECVGHVQKHLGSRLCSLKKRLGQSRLDDGKPIGGAGRLTNNTIDKVQVYYGRAVRNNPTTMKTWKMLPWLYGITPSQLMTVLTTAFVQRERISCVAIRGIKPWIN